MRMKGIVTMYRGRRFRSRLEARWAVLFDLFDWRYEYEPYDLEGWIPDFALFGAGEILVEIKPYSSLKEFDTRKILTALEGTEKWGKEILLLGSTLMATTNTNAPVWAGRPAVILGFLGEFEKGVGRELGGEYWFSRAILNRYEGWGFYHEEGGWGDRMTGLYEGDHYHRTPDYEEVLRLWNEAGNIVQFRGRR